MTVELLGGICHGVMAGGVPIGAGAGNAGVVENLHRTLVTGPTCPQSDFAGVFGFVAPIASVLLRLFVGALLPLGP
jgi:hypothetical protein